MLTKEQLKHYEVAARLYCERIGEDPEARVPAPHATLKGVTDMSGRVWHLAAHKLHDLSMMLTSLRDAAIAKDDAGKIITPP